MAFQLPDSLNKAINDFSIDNPIPWQIILSTIGTVCAFYIYLALRLILSGGEDESPVDITVPIPEQARNGGRWDKGTGQVWEGKGLKVWRAIEDQSDHQIPSRPEGSCCASQQCSERKRESRKFS